MRYIADAGLGFVIALSFVVLLALCAYAGVFWLSIPTGVAYLVAIYFLITRRGHDEVLFLSASVSLVLILLVAFAIAAREVLRTS